MSDGSTQTFVPQTTGAITGVTGTTTVDQLAQAARGQPAEDYVKAALQAIAATLQEQTKAIKSVQDRQGAFEDAMNKKLLELQMRLPAKP
jgi:hypothetical protein